MSKPNSVKIRNWVICSPKKTKTRNMNTRKDEIYKVHHANTGRYQKSFIIFMQNLLNEYKKINKNKEWKKYNNATKENWHESLRIPKDGQTNIIK